MCDAIWTWRLALQVLSQTTSVTFTLPGFSTVKRDGIDLSAGFTASVNADLRVGAVEETITVSGAAPLVTNLTATPSPSLLYCDNAAPYQTQVKLLGAYPLPWGFAASAAFQSIPGPQIGASFVVPNGQIVPTLGRNLSAGPNATVTAQLVAPGALYNDRLNQLDARLTRAFRLRGTRRAQGQLDFYNLLNAGPALNHNNTYGAAWLRPTVIPVGRMVKIGGQFDF